MWYTGWPPKISTICWYALTLSDINWFMKLFHCQNQKKICNNTITNTPTKSQVCCYNTLWNVMFLKQSENKTTSVATHFKRLTTGNSMFSVSVIVCSNCHILQFLHQMFNVLLDDTFKPTMLLTNDMISEMLQQFVLFKNVKKLSFYNNV